METRFSAQAQAYHLQPKDAPRFNNNPRVQILPDNLNETFTQTNVNHENTSHAYAALLLQGTGLNFSTGVIAEHSTAVDIYRIFRCDYNASIHLCVSQDSIRVASLPNFFGL
jgi:hypothetical protein